MSLKIKKITLGFALLCFVLVNAQQKLPFGIINHKEGYANVRIPEDDKRKRVDKIKKGELFIFDKAAEGETEWIWIQYPEKSETDKPFVRYESLPNRGMIYKERFTFIDQLPYFSVSPAKYGKTITLIDNNDTKIPESKRTKIHLDIGKSYAGAKKTEKDTTGKIILLDNAKPWGISDTIPEDLTEIKSIRIQQDGKSTSFSRDALKNMFQPTTNYDNMGAYLDGNGYLFFYMINGAGENRYTTIWTIKDGVVVSQIIYNNPE